MQSRVLAGVLCAICFAAGFGVRSFYNQEQAKLAAEVEQAHLERQREWAEVNSKLGDVRFALNKSMEEIESLKSERLKTNATLTDIKQLLDKQQAADPNFQPQKPAITHGRAWGPEQATGAPDVRAAGDHQAAWASLTEDGQPEWLLLEYAESVSIAKVKVCENYCPGALCKVTVFDDAGKEIEAWAGKDPTPATAPMGTSEIVFKTAYKSNRIKIYLDSVAIRGWNEIDAVGVVHGAGKTLWAVKASASSTYAEPNGVVENAPVAPPGDF